MKVINTLLSICGLLLLGCAGNQSRQAAADNDIAYNNKPGDIRIVSFNLRQSSVKSDGDNCWDNRKEAVRTMLAEVSPSVMGVQEGMPDQIEYIETVCPQFARIGVGREDGVNKGEMMAIFYRSDYFEDLGSGTFWLSETPDEVSQGWDGACKRTLTWAHLREKSTGKSFYYLNTHFDHRGPEARRQSALLVVDWVREHIPAEAAVIIGGDLNSSIDDPIFDPMKSEYLVARDIADPSDFEGTFNGFGSAPNNIVLDHFFCRGIDLEQKPVLMVLRGDYGAPYISDHYPVVFDFRLP